MIQGGDPDSRGASPDQHLGGGGPGYQIPAEFGYPHVKGALAAARTGGAGNPEKKSSGCQFYIVHGKKSSEAELDRMQQSRKMEYPADVRKKYIEEGGAPFLDMDYTVFGEVIEGMDVIDKIAAVQTAPGDRPLKDVKMDIKMIK